jgi:hypothetical protein
MQKWEYLHVQIVQIETFDLGPDINRYGSEGWELVGVNEAHNEPKHFWECYFKRPKQ